MRNIVLYIATSLDGYIARDDHSIDWLPTPEESKGEDHGYAAFYDSIDTTIMGKRTYDIVLAHGVKNPYPEKKNYVFTRSPLHLSNDDIEYVSGDIVAFTRNLKSASGKDIWLVGGGEINTLLLKHDLVDRIMLTIFPIVLGGGIPLFARGGKEATFRLSSVRHWKETDAAQMIYER